MDLFGHYKVDSVNKVDGGWTYRLISSEKKGYVTKTIYVTILGGDPLPPTAKMTIGGASIQGPIQEA